MRKTLALFLSGVALLWVKGAEGKPPVLAVVDNNGLTPADSIAPPQIAIAPKFNIAGVWNGGTTDNTVITCTGSHVKVVYNTSWHEHVFEGEYTDENTVTGIQVRTGKKDGRVTRMAVMLVVLSSVEMKAHWVALDSNSNIVEGTTGTQTLKRVAQPPAPEAGVDDHYTPKFDIAGLWNDGHPDNVVTTRTGRHVKSVYNTSDHEHAFEGEYTDDTTVVGIQVRRNRSNGTTTRMAVTWIFQSKDEAKSFWVALDSNSGLTEGQTGLNVLKRVKIMPAQNLDSGSLR